VPPPQDIAAYQAFRDNPASAEGSIYLFWAFYKQRIEATPISEDMTVEVLQYLREYLDRNTSVSVASTNLITQQELINFHIKCTQAILLKRAVGRTPEFVHCILALRESSLLTQPIPYLDRTTENITHDLANISIYSLRAIVNYELFEVDHMNGDYESAFHRLISSVLTSIWITQYAIRFNFMKMDPNVDLNTIDMTELISGTILYNEPVQIHIQDNSQDMWRKDIIELFDGDILPFQLEKFLELLNATETDEYQQTIKARTSLNPDTNHMLPPPLVLLTGGDFFESYSVLVSSNDIDFVPELPIDPNMIAQAFMKIRRINKVENPQRLHSDCWSILSALQSINDWTLYGMNASNQSQRFEIKLDEPLHEIDKINYMLTYDEDNDSFSWYHSWVGGEPAGTVAGNNWGYSYEWVHFWSRAMGWLEGYLEFGGLDGADSADQHFQRQLRLSTTKVKYLSEELERLSNPNRTYAFPSNSIEDNITQVLDIFDDCGDSIDWFDPYFDTRVLQHLAIRAKPSRIKHLRILSTQRGQTTDEARVHFFLEFQRQVRMHKIMVEWRAVEDISVHDRFIQGQNNTLNMVPSKTLLTISSLGSYSHANQTDPVRFNEWWRNAKPVD